MIRRFIAMAAVAMTAVPAMAQDTAWVQLQALPTLGAAQDAARGYSSTMENVSGFYLGGSWYGIALGPYSRPDAETLLGRLRSSGRIPADAFVSDGRRYGQQFWPIGTGAPTTPQPLPNDIASGGSAPATPIITLEPLPEPATVNDPVVIPEPVAEPQPVLAVETLAEARAAEALLTQGAREQLQIALQWAGYYNSTIDGSFGRGTRASMAAWQQDNGFEVTGVLTTAQRDLLLGAYNAILAGTDMTLIRDETAGIEVEIPAGLVAFSGYDSPFATYGEKDGSGVQVLLISQSGDRTRLYGLYEILQTLSVVPLNGPRSKSGDRISIEGVNDTIHTVVQASVVDGEIKGFALIWPTGDEERRSRVLASMQASFARIDGVLDSAAMPEGRDQSIDLVSGLEIRKPKAARAGFFVDQSGTVVTAAATVADCRRVTINDTFDATISYSDKVVAVIKPNAPLSPLGVVDFQTNAPRLQSGVTASGYPYGGALTLPTLTMGTLADLQGLDGNPDVYRLTMRIEDGDIGGPLYDAGGSVIGMIVPTTPASGQILPPEVSLAADNALILNALGQAGVTPAMTSGDTYMAPETLTRRAADVTALVSCW